MTPSERKNLIEVKTQLAARYRQKSKNAGSASKRRQSDMKATSYERQAAVLKAAE